MKGKQGQLEARIERIKEKILALGELRRGSLTQQYNVCGTPGCRCKGNPPRKHGPYYQLSFIHRGKNTSEFVRRENLARVKRQLRNYERLGKLIDEWIDVSRELARLPEASKKTQRRKSDAA